MTFATKQKSMAMADHPTISKLSLYCCIMSIDSELTPIAAKRIQVCRRNMDDQCLYIFSPNGVVVHLALVK